MEKSVTNSPHLPLGVRLNNPLNIRRSKSKWIGAVYDSKYNFVKFEKPFYGWRAAVIIMAITYYNRGWNTPAKIISNWAPYTENDTGNYIAFVCKYADVKPNKVLPPLPLAVETWTRFLIGMAKMEIGYRYVTETLIADLISAIYNVVQTRFSEYAKEEETKQTRN